jgi:gluconate 2-dehydrogenase gamma chain
VVAKDSANATGKTAPGGSAEGGMSGSSRSDPGVGRRELLITTAMTLVFSATSARALVVKDSLPWVPNAGAPPTAVHPGPWVYFTPEEGAAVEALVDRLIPPDPQTPGGASVGFGVKVRSSRLAGAMNCSSNTTESGPSLETGKSRNCRLALMTYLRDRTGAA